MPNTQPGKAIASRNATTHGLFARDIVLPSLGEDPQGYQQVAQELTAQLRPNNLLERHYVEKIAATSWRLRRLHRWQAQLFEDETLTEDERLDKLDKVLRHETALHRQIDTSVKMLAKDVPQLYARRVRDRVLEETQISERECREDVGDERSVDLETRGRLWRIRQTTEATVEALSQAPLDTERMDTEQMDKEYKAEYEDGWAAAGDIYDCQNERAHLPMSARASGWPASFLDSHAQTQGEHACLMT